MARDEDQAQEIVADRIRAAIMRGTFAPGTQLGEVDLANRLGVSRGPLREAWYPYTIPQNASGHPAMSVPFGRGAHDLPVGIQVMAPLLGEPVMFRVAAAIEEAAP